METPTEALSNVAREDVVKLPGDTDSFVSEYLKWKEPRQTTQERKAPLTLLELPVDILQLIVKEITHTNDLTALALTNSALYNLAIPLIYSRFDIVWPDGQITTSESKSVDALTYGLSTLCLGSAFARTTRRVFQSDTRRLTRFPDNEYTQYTKKFSLGNGPTDWVIEYMITKESGKMLGTLVAIAIAKMKNLETFTWDMPTGVLSDIFMALGSLAEQADNECKLNRVWVRWHDNSGEAPSTAPPSAGTIAPSAATVPTGSHLTAVGILIPDHANHPTPRAPVGYSGYHCEYPTFSILPPLRSLTVLDIDEVSYLDEMAVLIERSRDGLQELRIGISPKGVVKDFAQTWDGADLKQIDHEARWPGGSSIGERRLGGVLGVLVGKIYDIRQHRSSRGKRLAVDATVSNNSSSPATPVVTTAPAQVGEILSYSDTPGTLPTPGPLHIRTTDGAKAPKPAQSVSGNQKLLNGKLKLHTLELERVVLSLHVCRHAFDWTTLTHLTLLDCAQHENLWKMLRKQFQPTPVNNGTGSSCWKQNPADASLEYHLSLKSIHTDTTTLALVNFIKETLEPNTLEVLFLQDCKRGSAPPVPLSEVFKGAIKRHPTSLRKLLLDSSATKPTGTPATAPNSDNTRWKAWALSTEVVLYITSGRMTNLRELAVSLEYADWHTFLQRLPNIPQIRSLNITQMAGYPGGNFEPRELAHQIADIITLRPEIRLCYVGIGPKCFEMLEYRGDDPELGSSSTPDPTAPSSGLNPFLTGVSSIGVNGGADVDHDDAEDTSGDEEDDDELEDDDGEVDDDDEDEDDDDEDNTPTTATSDPDETQSEDEETEEEPAADEDDDGFVEPGSGGMRLRLREILFYDDKVAIFKARHGKL
ncbi:hypothetical protein QBC35DRAFT_215547 [Podospora australis]|uniref:F-box domain-containing protein n=1 Tax=Podospora australis TaxID=1536484 RepID=A0AAN7AGQ2_9PEZI|nr:hypothetical protein QBC35DRAFT_215547 [Podospora australis]